MDPEGVPQGDLMPFGSVHTSGAAGSCASYICSFLRSFVLLFTVSVYMLTGSHVDVMILSFPVR